MKTRFFILALLASVLLVFVIAPGCKKSVDKKIVGTWRRVPVYDLDDKDLTEWVFTENNEVYLNYTPFGGATQHQDTGQYITNTSFGKRYVEIVQCKNTENNKKYRIMKLNKKTLKLIFETKYGLTFSEYTKVE